MTQLTVSQDGIAVQAVVIDFPRDSLSLSSFSKFWITENNQNLATPRMLTMCDIQITVSNI